MDKKALLSTERKNAFASVKNTKERKGFHTQRQSLGDLRHKISPLKLKNCAKPGFEENHRTLKIEFDKSESPSP